MHFDLTDLNLFVRIAAAQNLTRGATDACLSPAAASSRVRALEEQLGCRLFYREHRGVSLTQSGETLLRHARLILRQVDHLKTDFSGAGQGAVGHIRIYANTTAVTEFMPELLARFMSERPGITVDLQERLNASILRGVLDGMADMGIVSGPVEAEGLQVQHFSTDRLVLVTPRGHELADAGVVSFSQAVRFEHICTHEGSSLQTFLRERSRQLGHALSIRVQVRSFEALCRMIEAGVGIGIVPQSAALRHRQTMQLAVIDLSDDWATRERMVLWRDWEALPACARDLVRALMASCSGGEAPMTPPINPPLSPG